MKIAFRIATKEIEIEEVNKESDTQDYEKCVIFSKMNCFVIIDLDEFKLYSKSIKVLTLIFKKNEQFLPIYAEQIYNLTMKLLKN